MRPVKTATALKELFATLGFEPARVVCAQAMYPAARSACVELVNIGGMAVQLRAHPSLPDDLMIVFGAEGSFEVVRLETQDES